MTLLAVLITCNVGILKFMTMTLLAVLSTCNVGILKVMTKTNDIACCSEHLQCWHFEIYDHDK